MCIFKLMHETSGIVPVEMLKKLLLKKVIHVCI